MSLSGNDGSLYKTKQWKAIRAKRFHKEPTCRMCRAQGIETPVFIVDHIKPHRGDTNLFFDFNNTQSLCKHHHDSAKQFQEKRGFSGQVGNDGWPSDPLHPVNVAGRS